MLPLFLLPLLFNPFSLLIKWLPGLYLAAWPIIIQTLGRETLITHALVLIMFILTCDISRQMMLKMIGLDLISFPLGIGLLIGLTTPKGQMFLSIIRPLFSGLLVVVEPLFLLIEIYLFMDMIRSFNRWISAKANVRDEDSHDLSSWEPPLSRGAVMARLAVILITICSYIGAYMIIQESKSLLEFDQSRIPINFNHAIAALVTLQLIAFSATIYREEGVLSESALTALLASIPIFIASWSYYHLKETAHTSPRFITEQVGQLLSWDKIFGYPKWPTLSLPLLADFGLMAPAADQRRGHTTLSFSLEELAKYYFGPDFWYILAGRFVCLFWWTMIWLNRRSNNNNNIEDHDEHQQQIAASRNSNANHLHGSGGSLRHQVGTIWLNLTSWLPISKQSLVKILLVLAYTQMLIQQMDNKHHLHEQVQELASADHDQSSHSTCCGQPTSGGGQATESSAYSDLGAWFNCMWSSAKACSAATSGRSEEEEEGGRFSSSRAARYYAWLVDNLMGVYQQLGKLAASFDLTAVYHVWLARWRSNIVQRLCQSMLVQLYYISHVLFVYE